MEVIMLKEINKWVPVHKNTILLLKDDPRCHLETLCVLYLYKTKVPADATFHQVGGD